MTEAIAEPSATWPPQLVHRTLVRVPLGSPPFVMYRGRTVPQPQPGHRAMPRTTCGGDAVAAKGKAAVSDVVAMVTATDARKAVRTARSFQWKPRRDSRDAEVPERSVVTPDGPGDRGT